MVEGLLSTGPTPSSLLCSSLFKALALWANAFYKSKCPSVCPSVRLSVCPSVCLFTFEVPFNGLFAHTSRSPIFLEIRNSWGKVMERSGLRYEHFCLKLSKIAAQKKVFFLSLFSLLRYRLTVFLPPLPEVGCPIFLEIWNPWGKVMERSGLRYEHFCLKIV